MNVCVIDLTETGVRDLVMQMGEPSYRASQLMRWIYKRLAGSYEEMTDLPAVFRHKLTSRTSLHCLTTSLETTGRDGTVKRLFALADGKTIESSLMSYQIGVAGARYTVCISTQVGCPIGCPFCATGQQGFERNLTSGEIVDQVLHFARLLRDRQGQSNSDSEGVIKHITNAVFMGMGEPLANYDALWQAIEILNAPRGFGLGARNMMISTAGLVPQIRRLSQEGIQVELAVSLHAANDWLRNELVPINKRYPLKELISACSEYSESTHRRISFEYILFKGINDSIRDAAALAGLIRGMKCHVNLIPANPTGNANFKPSRQVTMRAFQAELERQRISCTLRQRRGLDIDAGCGQFRSRMVMAAGAYSPSEDQVAMRHDKQQ